MPRSIISHSCNHGWSKCHTWYTANFALFG
ncbi:MAG: hypothetical protein E6R03_13390 [Hyphomicrobiaceae bacterium]|nr:MAG: hypothetical protein E6R03_13390 [Hyphomicrobiaceae bacterium]